MRLPFGLGDFTRYPPSKSNSNVVKHLILFINYVSYPSGMHIDIVSQYNKLKRGANKPRRTRRIKRDVISDCRLQIESSLSAYHSESTILNLKFKIFLVSFVGQ